jgi:hypothetical protein
MSILKLFFRRYVADQLCKDDNEVSKGLSIHGIVKLARAFSSSNDSSAGTAYSVLIQAAVNIPVSLLAYVFMSVCVDLGIEGFKSLCVQNISVPP